MTTTDATTNLIDAASEASRALRNVCTRIESGDLVYSDPSNCHSIKRLAELHREIVESLSSALTASQRAQGIREPTHDSRSKAMTTTYSNLESLYVAMRDNRPSTLDDHGDQYRTNLPTFGGDAPDDTEGVWSWNETHLIVGTCVSDLEIVERPAE